MLKSMCISSQFHAKQGAGVIWSIKLLLQGQPVKCGSGSHLGVQKEKANTLPCGNMASREDGVGGGWSAEDLGQNLKLLSLAVEEDRIGEQVFVLYNGKQHRRLSFIQDCDAFPAPN